MPKRCVVLVTAPDRRTGLRLARALVAERLAACVNLVGSLRSVYRWKGKVEEASEVLLLAKTRAALLPRLQRRVKALHPCSVPEVLALPVAGGSPSYLSWLDAAADARPR
ncbi:MAG: divalent-cation tolerance protein CutA [Elusimicrobiota bacterium]|jgi:periplasmic divalent cation tolerance protein